MLGNDLMKNELLTEAMNKIIEIRGYKRSDFIVPLKWDLIYKFNLKHFRKHNVNNPEGAALHRTVDEFIEAIHGVEERNANHSKKMCCL